MRKFVLQWHLTHKCNLRCTHCYQEDYSKDLELLDMENIFYQFLDFLKVNHFIGHINFTGGEPFLYKHLFEILDLCENNHITFGILTNGTLLNKELILKLKNYKYLKFVQVSIDGLKTTHDNIRGIGTFNKAFKTIKVLHHYHIQTMVAFTVHKKNYLELKKLIKYCRYHKVDRFWLDRLIPIGNNQENILSTEEYTHVVHILVEEQKNKKMLIHTNRAIQFISGGNCIYHCSAGDDLLVILADGTLLPCRRLPLEIGNLLKDNLSDLYQNSSILKELRSFKYPDECKNCNVKNLCKGGAKCLSYVIYKTYNKKDYNCYL